jgi:hypothetical protein
MFTSRPLYMSLIVTHYINLSPSTFTRVAVLRSSLGRGAG